LLDKLLQQLLDHSRLKRRELAQKSNLAPETLSRIGRRGTADFETVARLVHAAGMEITLRPAVSENAHDRLDARSLALHALIAGKLSADPQLLPRKVLPNIERFKRIHRGSGTERLLEEWEAASKAGLPALLRLCLDPTEHGQQLRQSSPLTGILTQAERKSVYDAYAA
jgi:hypothetical protein